MASKGDVLVALRDTGVRESLGHPFLAENYACTVTADAREAIEAFRARRPQLVVTDLHLGPEVVEQIRQEDLDVAVIVVSGGPTRQAATKPPPNLDIYYLTTPFEFDEMLFTMDRALERRQLLI